MTARKQEYLSAVAERIERYQPVLERDFGVQLGDVRAHEVRAREWIDRILSHASSDWAARTTREKGRPPTRREWFLHRAEVWFVRLVGWPFVALRLWWPDFIMMWDDRSRTVGVSFSGWSKRDFTHNKAKLDQYVVHELAHGVWERIGDDRDELTETWSQWRSWRSWNEGFTHYLADIHYRSLYPDSAVIEDDRESFRMRAREHVVRLVERCGTGVLPEIPRRWREFEAIDLRNEQGDAAASPNPHSPESERP